MSSGGLREAAMALSVADSPLAAVTERRISWLTLLIGLVAGLLVAALRDRLWGLGLGIGAALAWLNFRWLRQGAAALIRLGQAQSTLEKPYVPPLVHVKFFGRLLLLLVVAYVILAWLKLPAAAVICGLAAVVPAILIELGYEIVRGQHRWNEQ